MAMAVEEAAKDRKKQDGVTMRATLLAMVLVAAAGAEAQRAQNYACRRTSSEAENVGFCDRTKDMEERVADVVGRMTLPEKAAQLVNGAEGVARLGIPPYEWWSEALHGVSDVGPGTSFRRSAAAAASLQDSNTTTSRYIPAATSFPQVILSAASFNSSLWTAIGQAVSTEARAMYNSGQSGLTFWSPNVNIYRDPRWGRGQETAGEDPLLASSYAVAYVRGLQDFDDDDGTGVHGRRLKVAACCKHFTAYDIDHWNGIDRFHFDAKVSQQDLDDTYNPPFKSCVQAGGAACVMCSYNRVNGVPTCVDGDLLQGTLRGQWGLNGYIASDCDSVDVLYNEIHYTASPEDAAAAAVNAGLNMNCGRFLAKHTERAVAEGKLEERKVDESLSQLYRVLMRLGFFDGDPAEGGSGLGSLGPSDVCSEQHAELAAEAARQGIVLLKNEGGVLPFSETEVQNVAVIGPNANATVAMLGNYAGVPCEYVTPLQGLARYALSVVHVAGCRDVACSAIDPAAMADAEAAAGAADAVVLVMGLDQSQEREGKDRTSLALPGQQAELASRVASAAKGPVVLVLMNGGPLDVEFAKRSDSIRGMLWVGYPGQAGGQAIAETIFGDHNPAGKLPVSWYPENYTEISMADMRMRADMGGGYPGRTYRFYTGPTLFPFGYGLSYTRFSQTLQSPARSQHLNLATTLTAAGDGYVAVAGLACGDLGVELEVEVENVGRAAGSHVVLVFWHPPERWWSDGRAARRQLVAFRRVEGLKVGEARRVTVDVNVCHHMSVAMSMSEMDDPGAAGPAQMVVPTGTHKLVMGDQEEEEEAAHNIITLSLSISS